MLTRWLQWCFPLPGQGQADPGASECVASLAGLVQQTTSVAARTSPLPSLDSSRPERPLFVAAQLTLNCFASFLLFSFVLFLFVCVAVGPRAPGRMNF